MINCYRPRLVLTAAIIFLATQPLNADSNIGCFVNLQCDDPNVVGINSLNLPEECLAYCQEIQGCQYWTHYSDQYQCLLYGSCTEQDVSCDDCVSGNRYNLP